MKQYETIKEWTTDNNYGDFEKLKKYESSFSRNYAHTPLSDYSIVLEISNKIYVSAILDMDSKKNDIFEKHIKNILTDVDEYDVIKHFHDMEIMFYPTVCEEYDSEDVDLKEIIDKLELSIQRIKKVIYNYERIICNELMVEAYEDSAVNTFLDNKLYDINYYMSNIKINKHELR